jgi:hypothetical protein
VSTITISIPDQAGDDITDLELSALLPSPPEILAMADITDEEHAALQPTPAEVLAHAVADALAHAVTRWEVLTVPDATWVPHSYDEGYMVAQAGRVSFEDFMAARAKDWAPHVTESAERWLREQPDDWTRGAIERYDALAARLDQYLKEERVIKQREDSKRSAIEREARQALERRQRSGNVWWRARGRGQVAMQELDGAINGMIWAVPRIITLDYVPEVDDEGFWVERRQEVVVLVLDRDEDVQLITGTFLSTEDFTAMVGIGGLKEADEGTVARTLGTTRLQAARTMQSLDRPVYRYDHNHWMVPPAAGTRAASAARPRKATVADRITAMLGHEARTVGEIAAAIGSTNQAVLVALKRGAFEGTNDRPARWRVPLANVQVP